MIVNSQYASFSILLKAQLKVLTIFILFKKNINLVQYHLARSCPIWPVQAKLRALNMLVYIVSKLFLYSEKSTYSYCLSNR